jgi:hypothetical protein
MKEPPGHGAILAGTIAAMTLAMFTVFSAGSVTHGFVSYYTASMLLVRGGLDARAYDDRWFGEQVKQLTASNVREIFVPNPPSMSLMALPLVRFDAQTARAAWLFASLALFLAAVGALVRYQAHRGRDLGVPIVMLMLLMPAVFTNLRIGQGYLIVFALFASAVILVMRERDRTAGIMLGLLLALKTSGVALAVILAARRRWRVLAAAAVTVVVVALAIMPFVGIEMWRAYPSAVREYVNRPASSVTAYQTTLGLFRHLCVADAQWNPSPAANCGSIAFVVPALINGGATLVTMLLALRARRPEPWLSAAAALSVVTLPAVAEPHFVLMAIPLALLRLSIVETVVIAALLIVPMEWTAERFTAGWWALLAYPRLYAGWLLWGISVRELRA